MTTTDSDFYFRIHGDPEIVRYIRKAKSRTESDLFLQEHLRLNETLQPFGRWLVEDKATGEFIGTFVIIPVEGEPGKFQLGYALVKEKWGQGLATELTMGGLAYAKSVGVLSVIHAYTEPGNLASIAVLKKCGFVQETVSPGTENALIGFVANLIS